MNVIYQPIDVQDVHDRILPFALGQRDDSTITLGINAGERSSVALAELRDARSCLQAGSEYYSLQWGRCYPDEFLESHFVHNVLEFCQSLYPNWDVNAITSIELLPKDFPVLEHYCMPKQLFLPVLEAYPEIAYQLETIAECECMGGVIPATSVSSVRKAIHFEHKSNISRGDPYYLAAGEKLLAALEYAEQHELSFTEVFG